MTIQLSARTWEALYAEYNEALLFSQARISTLETQAAQLNAQALAQYVSHVAPYDRQTETVRHYGIDWHPVDNDSPYATFEEMKEAWYAVNRGINNLEVSDCWHDHPVFNREQNLSFRVWHDTDHVRSDLAFDRDSEVRLFVWQARDLPRTVAGQRCVEALFCESVYQLSAAVVLGRYPERQAVRTPGPVGRALLDAWGF